MATQRIVNGPSRWDIMMAFFEKKTLVFTLEDGTAIELHGVVAMWNMKGYDPIDGHLLATDNSGGGISEGYLLRGSDELQDVDHFVEYRTRSRQGAHIALSNNGPDPAFMPDIWANIMGFDTYTIP